MSKRQAFVGTIFSTSRTIVFIWKTNGFIISREESNMTNLFHLAFPVHDLVAAREFYGGVLECEEGRSSERWVDFNLYGIRS
jgi:hypothetical protein